MYNHARTIAEAYQSGKGAQKVSHISTDAQIDTVYGQVRSVMCDVCAVNQPIDHFLNRA